MKAAMSCKDVPMEGERRALLTVLEVPSGGFEGS
jgi:hypothetical protein